MKSGLLMSESPEIVPTDIAARPTVGAGQLLRQAREAAGLHIAALAVMLKVPVKKLEALEGNHFELLPDAVFVRALASSVCRTLKIDATPILAQLPVTSSPRLTYQTTCMNEAFRSPGDGPGPTIWTQLSKPAVLAGLALLLGTLVLVFLPALKVGVTTIQSSAADSAPVGIAKLEAQKLSDTSPQAKLAPPDVVAATSASVSNASPPDADGGGSAQTTVTMTASSPAPTSDLKALALGGSPGTSSPTFVTSASSPSSADIVVFTAQGESWVEATDAKGQVVLRRMLIAGDVVGAAGTLPLRVVVGRANMTQVHIRGKGFDLSPVSKDNVARFEVK